MAEDIERKRKIRSSKSKNRRASAAPRNRYMRRAKLSEYRFLKILRGFADNETAGDLAPRIRISDKTIRRSYAAFRERLIPATAAEPFRFGGAGFFLFSNGRLSHGGKLFLESVYESELYRTQLRRHAPRLNDDAPEADSYLIEVAVRVFCYRAMQKDAETLYSEETRQALQNLREIGAFIEEYQDDADFKERYGWLIERYHVLAAKLPAVVQEEALAQFSTLSTWHRFPDHILYEDLRRHLLTHPL